MVNIIEFKIINMEHLNLIWFNKINAAANLHGFSLWTSVFLAKYLVILTVLWLFGLWLWGNEKYRNILLLAFSSCMIGFILNWVIGLFLYHPRPFAMGVGHTYIKHAYDSSFPSDHMTALCAISFILLWEKPRSIISIFLLLIALIVGWARIYVGIHFPFDMIGAVIIALLSSATTIYFSPLIKLYAFPKVQHIYRLIFSGFIRRKWVKN